MNMCDIRLSATKLKNIKHENVFKTSHFWEAQWAQIKWYKGIKNIGVWRLLEGGVNEKWCWMLREDQIPLYIRYKDKFSTSRILFLRAICLRRILCGQAIFVVCPSAKIDQFATLWTKWAVYVVFPNSQLATTWAVQRSGHSGRLQVHQMIQLGKNRDTC